MCLFKDIAPNLLLYSHHFYPIIFCQHFFTSLVRLLCHLHWVEQYPPKSRPPGTSEGDFIWKQGLCRWRGHAGWGWALNPRTGVLIRQSCAKKARGDRGRGPVLDYRPGNAQSHQKLEGGGRALPEGTAGTALPRLGVRLLASGLRENSFLSF